MTASFHIQKILDTAYELLKFGNTCSSTGEHLAAALALNRPDLLPAGYTVKSASQQLTPQWKQYVLDIQRNHGHKIRQIKRNLFYPVQIIKPESDRWHDHMCAALAGMCSVWLTRRQTPDEWMALSEDIDVVASYAAEVADKALVDYENRFDD